MAREQDWEVEREAQKERVGILDEKIEELLKQVKDKEERTKIDDKQQEVLQKENQLIEMQLQNEKEERIKKEE